MMGGGLKMLEKTRLTSFLSPVEGSLKIFLGLWGRGIENSRTRKGVIEKFYDREVSSLNGVYFCGKGRGQVNTPLHDMMMPC